jgi:endonuclease YncB( thermonuclease family)
MQASIGSADGRPSGLRIGLARMRGDGYPGRMRRWRRKLVRGLLLLGFALALAAWLLGRTRPPGPQSNTAPEGALARVERVVDGDTVEVRLLDGGGRLTVRLLGIDCPESRPNDKCRRAGRRGGRGCDWQVPRGRRAGRMAREILERRRVRLECGRRCRRGGYGRALRYLRLEDGRDFGLEMVRRGLCRDYGHRYPHPRGQRYRRAEGRARRAERGIWAR